MKKARVLNILIAVIFVFSLPFTAYGAIPQTMNYQGYLTNSGGAAVNGTVSIVFSIYNAPSGGTNLWTETQAAVSVNNGIYSVVLGSVNPINLAFDSQYYLGVKVGSDNEMTPRQALASVGYAMRSAKSDAVSDGAITNASVAAGAGISYSKLNHPDSDHSEQYYSKSQSDALIAAMIEQIMALSNAIQPSNTYVVTYNGNNNTAGNPPVDATHYQLGQTITAKGNTSFLAKTGYKFNGWNTQYDGNGTTYTQGQTFTMGAANITLYAKWTSNTTYTVTYNGNSNTGGGVPTDTTNYEQGQTVTVFGNTGNLVKTGSSFGGWNTQADGNGTTYTQGQTFTMGTANAVLYAKWSKPDGTACTTDPECASSICECSDEACATRKCSATNFICSYTTNGSTSAGYLTSGSDPDDDCSGSSTCNGLGSCGSSNGTACTSASECTSSICECSDASCFSRKCSATNFICSYTTNGSTSAGYIAFGTDPDNDCSGALTCNGGGSCE